MSEIRVLRNDPPPPVPHDQETAQLIRERWAREEREQHRSERQQAKQRSDERRRQRLDEQHEQRQQREQWLLEEIAAAANLDLVIAVICNWHDIGTGFARVFAVRNSRPALIRSVYVDRKKVCTLGTLCAGTFIRCRIGEAEPGYSVAQALSIEIFKSSED